MANIAISALPVATSQAGGDVLPIVQATTSTTKQLSVTNLFTSPTFITPALGTVASGNISACTSTSMALTTPVIGAATGTSLTATMFSAAGTTTAATFTVTNSTVTATDVIILNQKSGTDLYDLMVTAVAAGSFSLTFRTTGGTTTETPVFNFAVIKAVAA